MSDELLQRLAPQMADYRAETQVYVPYVMHGARPAIRRLSHSTDEYGFRRTLRGGEPMSLAAFHALPAAGKPSALIGNSTAFGVGASSDAATIASQLNALGSRVWFNFAGRTFNQVQELIAFLLFAPARVDTAVLMTGINLLDMSYRFASEAHVPLAPFHLERLFLSRLDRQPDDRPGALLHRLWCRLRGRSPGDGFLEGEVCSSLRRGLEDGEHLVEQPLNLGRALDHFRRMVGIWSDLVPRRIGRLVFALQPVPDLFGRPLSAQETQLLAASETHRPPSWHVVREHVRGQADAFREGTLAACRDARVESIDLNASPLTETPWVFIDRYHLTDAAQARIAALLAAFLGP